MTSYDHALDTTRCESIEATLRSRTRLRAEALFRISGGRLPNQTIFGNLWRAVRKGRSGKVKEWTYCVQSDIRAFGIAGNWKVTALEAEVRVEMVAKGRWRCMAAWRTKRYMVIT